MGGNAFADLGEDAFPRIPPDTYRALKARLADALSTLYQTVGTPEEAPEKADHGDVDFIVCGPIGEVKHEDVKGSIGAEHAVIAEGNRTSNYAIPSDEESKFYQVDVHVCSDIDEWDRIMFFHSYGDMGMILGVVARANSLQLGTGGLKILDHDADETQPVSFLLSNSFPQILPFFVLSMDTWTRGFKTTSELFDWISTSRFFIPRRISDPHENRKALRKRTMYQSFLAYSHALKEAGEYEKSNSVPDKKSIIQEALAYFGKQEEYNAIVAQNHKRLLMKQKFTGKHVMEWTGLYGVVIRQIMDGMRTKIGEDGILNANVDDLRKLALSVREELGLVREE